MKDNLSRCIECETVFEMPTRYVLPIRTSDNGSTKNIELVDRDFAESIPIDGLCFRHLKSEKDREIVGGDRIKHLREKYNMSKFTYLHPQIVQKLDNLHWHNNPADIFGYELEKALLAYTIQTGNDIAPCILINSVPDEQGVADNAMITVLRNLIESKFRDKIFHSAPIKSKGGVIIIPRVEGKFPSAEELEKVVNLSEVVRYEFERAPKNYLDFIAFTRALGCHNKRKPDMLEYASSICDLNVEAYFRLSPEQRVEKRFVA